MTKTRAIVFAALVAVAVGASPVQAQVPDEMRVVEGQVVNGTSDAGAPEGLRVVLLRDKLGAFDDLETATDADGRFSFGPFPFDAETTYGVSTRYEDAVYGTDVDLSEGSPPPVVLTVYDASDDIQMIEVAGVSVLYAQTDKVNQTVQALEIVAVVNATDMTFVPGPSPMSLLRFGLPPETEELQVDTRLLGADYIQVDRGFGLSAAVPPGTHEVLFAYKFPYSDPEVGLDRSFLYGAESLRVLALPELTTLSSGELGQPQLVDIGGRAFQLLEGSSIPRGAQVSWRLSDLPTASLSDRLERTFTSLRLEYVAPSLLVVVMAVLVGVAVWRRRGDTAVVAGEESGRAGVEREVLMRSLADVEARYEEGQLSEAEYQAQRGTLIERIAGLSREE